MPEIIETTVYRLDELSDAAKEDRSTANPTMRTRVRAVVIIHTVTEPRSGCP